MDGEPAEVAGDPAAVELLGDGGRRAAAAEAIEDQIVRLDEALMMRSSSASGFWVG